jgi:hypothetical protein
MDAHNWSKSSNLLSEWLFSIAHRLSLCFFTLKTTLRSSSSAFHQYTALLNNVNGGSRISNVNKTRKIPCQRGRQYGFPHTPHTGMWKTSHFPTLKPRAIPPREVRLPKTPYFGGWAELGNKRHPLVFAQ